MTRRIATFGRNTLFSTGRELNTSQGSGPGSVAFISGRPVIRSQESSSSSSCWDVWSSAAPYGIDSVHQLSRRGADRYRVLLSLAAFFPVIQLGLGIMHAGAVCGKEERPAQIGRSSLGEPAPGIQGGPALPDPRIESGIGHELSWRSELFN